MRRTVTNRPVRLNGDLLILSLDGIVERLRFVADLRILQNRRPEVLFAESASRAVEHKRRTH